MSLSLHMSGRTKYVHRRIIRLPIYHTLLMRLINRDNIEIVDVFIRLYGELLEELAPHYKGDIIFRDLSDADNEYNDIMGRVGNVIYHSEKEVGHIGLSDTEVLAALAHEIGHIVYNTRGWQRDQEERADSFAAELGLGNQMISAIEKIISSHRYHNLTSLLVGRIHFLQNMIRV